MQVGREGRTGIPVSAAGGGGGIADGGGGGGGGGGCHGEGI